MTNQPIRHGEIMLVPVDEVPQGKTHKKTSHVVGHSETGHHHVLESKQEFTVLDIDKAFTYLVLTAPAKLVHQKTVDKHKTLPVAPGKYKVVYKNEYNPFLQEIQKVQD